MAAATKLDFATLRKQLTLPIITIYRHPKDYPEGYVGRVFDINQPTMLCRTGDTLTQVRDRVPPEMHRIPRNDNDDPVIVESWI